MASPPMATDADLDRVVVVAAGGVVGVGLAAAPRRLGVPAHLRSPRVAAEPLVLKVKFTGLTQNSQVDPEV